MKEQDLGDGMNLQPSRDFPGNSVAVCHKSGCDICACCHERLTEFRDAPCGTTYIRVCMKKSCLQSISDELSGRKRTSFINRIKSAFKV